MLEPDMFLLKTSDIKQLMQKVDANDPNSLDKITTHEDPKVIAYKPQIASYLQSIEAAIYWQQLSHWQKYSKSSDGFFYKSALEMEQETYISEKKQRRCRQQLENMGWIETKKKMANGHPTYHFKVLMRSFSVLIPTGQTPNGTGQNASSITKNTSLEGSTNVEPNMSTTPVNQTAAEKEKKEKAALALVNEVTGRTFRVLPRGITKTLKTFALDDVRQALENLAKDPWHQERLGELSSDYLLRASTIDKFLNIKAEGEQKWAL